MSEKFFKGDTSFSFDCNLFSIFPYYWGGCTCGIAEDNEEHKPDCKLCIPNFHYKLTNYQLNWYKYPLRDSYANQNLSFDEFKAMIDNCIQAVKLLN